MAIITKVLKKISVKVFEQYSLLLTELIGDEQGIYVLYKADKIYYVGKAVDLKRRIKQHLEDRHGQKWDTFSLFVVKNEEHINELESLLVAICNPSGNRTNPSGKAKDLRYTFEKNIDAYHKEQKALLFADNKRACDSKKCKNKKEVQLFATYHGKEYDAYLLKSNYIQYKGKVFSSPSGAGMAIVREANKKSNPKNRTGINGLLFWKVKDENGKLIPLKQYLK